MFILYSLSSSMINHLYCFCCQLFSANLSDSSPILKHECDAMKRSLIWPNFSKSCALIGSPNPCDWAGCLASSHRGRMGESTTQHKPKVCIALWAAANGMNYLQPVAPHSDSMLLSPLEVQQRQKSRICFGRKNSVLVRGSEMPCCGSELFTWRSFHGLAQNYER